MRVKKISLLFFLFLFMGFSFVSAESFGWGETEDVPINYTEIIIYETSNDTEHFQGYTPLTLGSYLESFYGWVSDLSNYFTKIESDGRYLQNETDALAYNGTLAYNSTFDNYYKKNEIRNNSEDDLRFYTDSNPRNLVGNGNFEYQTATGTPSEWSGFTTSYEELVSSKVTLQENGTITFMDSSSWAYNDLFSVNLSVSNVDLSDPYLTEKFVTLYGNTASALSGYSLVISEVWESYNIIQVEVPVAYNKQQGWNVIGYTPQDVTGENFNITAIASRAGTALQYKSGTIYKNKQVTTAWQPFNPLKPLTLSFEYLTVNRQGTNEPQYIQIEVKDANGKITRRYLADMLIYTGYPCEYEHEYVFGGACESWRTAERTFENMVDPVSSAQWKGSQTLASRTDKMYFRVVVKAYDDGCSGAACSDFYVTGLTANNGYKTYANSPKYLNQEGNQVIYGDLTADDIYAYNYYSRTEVDNSSNPLETIPDSADLISENGNINHSAFGECYESREIKTPIYRGDCRDDDFDCLGEVIDYVIERDDVVRLSCVIAKTYAAVGQLNKNIDLYDGLIDFNSDVMADNLFFKSKAVSPELDYTSIFSDAVPFLTKHTSKYTEDYVLDTGVLIQRDNAEDQIKDLQGYILQNEFCRKNIKKYNDYNLCMDNGKTLGVKTKTLGVKTK